MSYYYYNQGIHCPEPSLDPPEWDDEEVDEEFDEDMAFEEARERAAGWLD